MKGELKQNNRSNITISTQKKIFDKIQQDAKSEGLSINAKINEILTKYTLFYRHVEEKRGVILPHNFMKGIVEIVQENEFVQLLDDAGGNETIPALFAHNNIPMTLDNLIKYFFEGMSLWAGAYDKFRHYDDNGYTFLVMEHDFGIKYSRMLGAVMSHFVKKSLNCDANFKALLTTIIVRVANRK